MPSFLELQLITVLLLICDSCMSWSTSFASLKLGVRFSIFDSALFLLKFLFLFNKMHGLFDFKNVYRRNYLKERPDLHERPFRMSVPLRS